MRLLLCRLSMRVLLTLIVMLIIFVLFDRAAIDIVALAMARSILLVCCSSMLLIWLAAADLPMMFMCMLDLECCVT